MRWVPNIYKFRQSSHTYSVEELMYGIVFAGGFILGMAAMAIISLTVKVSKLQEMLDHVDDEDLDD